MPPQSDSVRISLNREYISRQESVKYLGVEVDQNLTWEKQVLNVRQKSLAALAAIRRASAYLPTSTLRLLYNALVLPHLDYCSVVTGSKSLSDIVERVQNYAMRVILQRLPRSSSEALRNVLGSTTLHRRH